jgi:hypothetical protein
MIQRVTLNYTLAAACAFAARKRRVRAVHIVSGIRGPEADLEHLHDLATRRGLDLTIRTPRDITVRPRPDR